METIRKYRPLFKSKRVLKAEHLQHIANQTYLYPTLEYKNYSNGIISGCNVSISEEHIIISSGLFCYENEVFMIEDEVLMKYAPTNCWMYIKIRHIDHISKDGEQIQVFSLVFDNNITAKNEIELCRFHLQHSAKLRINYDDFDDMNTEFNTVNILHVPYSSENESTLHPQVLRMFANEFKTYNPKSTLDQVFCLQCINQCMSLNLDGIATYLKFRDDVDVERKTNINIYRELQRIILEAKNKNKPIEKKIIPKKKIIVD